MAEHNHNHDHDEKEECCCCHEEHEHEEKECCCHDEHKHEHNHDHEHHIDVDCCCCDHDDDEDEEESKAEKIMLYVGAAIFVVALIIMLVKKITKADIGEFVYEFPFVITAFLCGFPTAKSGIKSLMKKNMSEALLMTISVVAALIIGEFFEAAAVALLFRVGEMLEDYASERSKKSIESLFSIVSDTGNIVKADGSIEKIDADDIKVGMKLALLPHEVVPVDGVIVEGATTIDTSAITGESIPVEAGVGTKLVSGSMNVNNTVYYEATAIKAESGAARIVNMVEEATGKKGKSQKLVASFAKYYTPIIVGCAVLLFVIGAIATHSASGVKDWLHRALVVLVASCPCSIVLSVPLAFLSSMGACAKNGMIIKGSNFIEELAAADAVAFDKTGTLTTDKPLAGKVTAVEGFTEDEVLQIAAKCEYYSSHPLAKAIVEAAGEVDMKYVSNYAEIPGGGTSIDTEKGKVLCGGQRLMKASEVDVSALPVSSVYVALKGKAIGCIEIVNEIRPEAKKAIANLRALGIKTTMMLTGDMEERAKEVTAEIGLDGYKCQLLPQHKLQALEEIKKTAKSIIYVGDGINDAPVLASANAGVAMGLGTQAASEAADVILTDSDLSRLADTVKQSQRTMGVLKANIILSIVFKLVVILLGIFVPSTPLWLAVVADVGTMIICVINAARLLKVERMQ